jgi:hypothetical protein
LDHIIKLKFSEKENNIIVPLFLIIYVILLDKDFISNNISLSEIVISCDGNSLTEIKASIRMIQEC